MSILVYTNRNRRKEISQNLKRKRASEIFGSVDPNLEVINASHRHLKKPLSNWEASAGAICPKCHEEAVRFRPEDGVCRQCADALNEKQDRDEKKRAKFLRFMKAHNARIEKRKRATYLVASN